MIVEFKVRNFMSVKEEQVLSFEATADNHLRDSHCIEVGPKLRLLKIAAVFGANASGKSNILKALDFMRRMIIYSVRDSNIMDGTGLVPFKLSQETVDAPGTFEITFIRDSIKYVYGFRINSRVVLEEWLYHHPKGKRSKLFTRKYITSRDPACEYEYDWGTALKGEKRKLAELTPENALFLSVSSRFKHVQLNNVFRWFKGKLQGLIYPHTNLLDFTSLMCRDDKRFRGEIVNMLKHADFKIDDILFERAVPGEMIPVPGEKSPGEKFLVTKVWKGTEQEIMWQKILFRHQLGGEHAASVNLDFREESLGTQRYFELAGPLLAALENGGIMCIDELEASLHTRLISHFLKTFLNNSGNAQIIFTSHDLQIMDLELLRRDEIWFTEMKPDGQTELYCLSDFHPRKDKSIRNGYMNGAYGAVPLPVSYYPGVHNAQEA